MADFSLDWSNPMAMFYNQQQQQQQMNSSGGGGEEEEGEVDEADDFYGNDSNNNNNNENNNENNNNNSWTGQTQFGVRISTSLHCTLHHHHISRRVLPHSEEKRLWWID